MVERLVEEHNAEPDPRGISALVPASMIQLELIAVTGSTATGSPQVGIVVLNRGGVCASGNPKARMNKPAHGGRSHP